MWTSSFSFFVDQIGRTATFTTGRFVNTVTLIDVDIIPSKYMTRIKLVLGNRQVTFPNGVVLQRKAPTTCYLSHQSEVVISVQGTIRFLFNGKSQAISFPNLIMTA